MGLYLNVKVAEEARASFRLDWTQVSAAAAWLDGGHAEDWPLPGETEAAGLDDDKAVARLATEHEEQVGLSQSGKMHNWVWYARSVRS